MDRQRRNRSDRQPAELSDEARRVAERLEQLSVDDAERVLERAIALQAQQTDVRSDRKMMDRATLQRIADELDIDATHLERALVEELYRLDAEDPTWVDRLALPTTIGARSVAPLAAADAGRVLDLWMERHEGMRKARTHGGAVGWRKNTSLAASARRALRMSDSSGYLRRTEGVTTRVRPATKDQSVVVVEANTSRLRSLALAALGVAGVSVAGGVATIAASSLGGDGGLVGAGAGIVGAGVLVGGGVWLGVRMWVDRIRDAAQRAVDAIANPELIRDRSIGGIIGELVTDWTDFAGDIASEMRSKRRPE